MLGSDHTNSAWFWDISNMGPEYKRLGERTGLVVWHDHMKNCNVASGMPHATLTKCLPHPNVSVSSSLVWQTRQCFPWRSFRSHDFSTLLPDNTQGRERWQVGVKFDKNLCRYDPCLIWHGDHCERKNVILSNPGITRASSKTRESNQDILWLHGEPGQEI